MPTVDTWTRLLAAFMCLFVFLYVFTHDISKHDAARITKLHVKMFQNDSWKPVHFGIKTQRSTSRGTKQIASMGHGALVSAGFF